MNPTKKKEIVARVIERYKQYKADLIEYYSHSEKDTNTISLSQSPQEYYDSQSAKEDIKIKPNIWFYMDKYERKVLKKILEKKPGYENIKLN